MRPLSSPLARSLLSDRTFDIEFQGYLTNHAKHGVIALDRLGASPSRVREYWDQYTTVAHPLHKVEWTHVKPISKENWVDCRGKKIAWQQQVAFMHGELRDRFDGNVQLLVQEYAPDLFSGLAGALTHGIVHLGWALDADSPWMVCEGLAYLNFCHIGVDETKFQDHQSKEASLYDSLIRVASAFESQNLQENWVETTKAAHDSSFHPELLPAVFQWQLSTLLHEPHPVATELPTWLTTTQTTSIEETWESLYRSVVLLYLATRDTFGNGNFFVLHLLTSLWGLEQATASFLSPSSAHTTLGEHFSYSPTVDPTRRALCQYYASLICLLATTGFPSVELLQKARHDLLLAPGATDGTCSNTDEIDCWSDIVERGIAIDVDYDEHNAKQVYVARELWHRYNHWSGFVQAARSFVSNPS
jgi:hypothetical protein